MENNKDKNESKKNEVKRSKSNKEKNASNNAEIKRSFFGSRKKKKDLSKENSFNDTNGAKSKENSTRFDAGLNNASTNESGDFDQTPKGALMVTEPHAEEYFMGHEKRGKAIILNHEVFEKEEPREGTKEDVKRIEHVFGEILNFEVQVHNDLDFVDIISLIQTLSKADYNNCDCLAIFVLSHGRKGEISAKDIYYPAEKLWDNFAGDKCPTLAGKPKLFFISACRGKKKDNGIRLFRGRTQADSSNKPMTYKLPNQADFLIAFSTAEGYYSYRDIYNGTWFIECLCNVIKEHHENKDLMKMLTITQRKVAIDYRSQSDKVEDNDLTQIPTITTMLIRDVYFRSKNKE